MKMQLEHLAPAAVWALLVQVASAKAIPTTITAAANAGSTTSDVFPPTGSELSSWSPMLSDSPN